MAIIFDLDQTLVDSSIADTLRRQRKWQEVYDLISQFAVYEGINQLIEDVLLHEIPVCIVTSSHSVYCNKVLAEHNLNIVQRVCYHDTNKHKPYPDPINEAIKRLGVDKNSIISIGDDPRDITASKRAGIYSIAATWGAADRAALIEAEPDLICDSVEELSSFIRKKYIGTK